ncbi:MAG: hypothetical protein GY775_17010 [Candidatus Scalindua sp.]|nr:hypothetical protein [Candidatus Scalindua sp.]
MTILTVTLNEFKVLNTKIINYSEAKVSGRERVCPYDFSREGLAGEWDEDEGVRQVWWEGGGRVTGGERGRAREGEGERERERERE